MKKMIFPLLFSLTVGIGLAYFMLSQYEHKAPMKPVLGSRTETVYFFQYGIYADLSAMEKNTTGLPYYIYQMIEDKYHVYIGITKDADNVIKMEGYFREQGYDTYVKKVSVNDEKFLTVLEQYDSLLKATDDTKSIGAIISQVLGKYEEEEK